MPGVIPTGVQSYEKLKENNYFLIDKTLFIKDWWESGDAVTLITRPRRFGKTLNMDMLNCFFSSEYAGRADIIMIPKDTKKDNGIIIEFKVRSQRREQNLDETVKSALDQIERNMYSQKLTDAGVPEERIRKYGFAFEGKNVKIGNIKAKNA